MAKDLRPRHPATPAAPPSWEYAPAPESRDVVSIKPRYDLFVGGEFVEQKSGRRFETIEPSTEATLAEVAEAGPEDVDLAVKAAARDRKSTRLNSSHSQ